MLIDRFGQNKALYCPLWENRPNKYTSPQWPWVGRASPWGGVLVQCTTWTPISGSPALRGDKFFVPWLHHSNTGNEGQNLRPEGVPSQLLPSFPLLPGLGHSTCDPGFTTKGWVFFQLLQPVNMTTSSVDNRVQGGSGHPGSALAGVVRVVVSLVQHLGVPRCRGLLSPSPSSLPPALGSGCCLQKPSCHLLRDAQCLEGLLAPVASGRGADGLSAELE